TLRPWMPVAESAGLANADFRARDFLQHRLRVERDFLDVRQTIRAGVNPFDHGGGFRALGADNKAAAHVPAPHPYERTGHDACRPPSFGGHRPRPLPRTIWPLISC